MTIWTYQQIAPYLILDLDAQKAEWTVRPKTFESFEVEIVDRDGDITTPEVRLDLLNLERDGRPFDTMQLNDEVQIEHNSVLRFAGYIDGLEYLNQQDVARIRIFGKMYRLKSMNLGERNAEKYEDQDWHLQYLQTTERRSRNRDDIGHRDGTLSGMQLLARYYNTHFDNLVRRLFQQHLAPKSGLTIGTIDTSDSIPFFTEEDSTSFTDLLSLSINRTITPPALYDIEDPVIIDGKEFPAGTYWGYTTNDTTYTFIWLHEGAMQNSYIANINKANVAGYGFLRLSDVEDTPTLETLKRAVIDRGNRWLERQQQRLGSEWGFYIYGVDEVTNFDTVTMDSDNQGFTYVAGRAEIHLHGAGYSRTVRIPFLFSAPYNILDSETYLDYTGANGTTLLTDLARYGLAQYWVNPQGELIFRSLEEIQADSASRVPILKQHIHGGVSTRVEPLDDIQPSEGMNLNGFNIDRLEEHYEGRNIQITEFEYSHFPLDRGEGDWAYYPGGPALGFISAIEYYTRSQDDMHVKLTCRRLIDGV